MKVRSRAAGALLGVAVLVTAIVGVAGPADAIVGGTLASRAAYPYFADFPQAFGVGSNCGASVIVDSWVLTAAHCVAGRSAVTTGVYGAGNFTGQVIVHPLWNGNYEDGHDLALVHLPPGATAGVTPIQVGAPWDPGAYASGNGTTMMGAGHTSATDTAHGTFRAVDTVLRSDDYMDDIFNPWWGVDHWLEALMIGAGATNQSVCYGDSGGPLVVNRNGHPVQVGVASFIHDADNCSGAAGFAELAGPQLAWIASQVPAITTTWGACTTANGLAGHGAASYGGTYQPPVEYDGPIYWKIWCQVQPTITVPDVRGRTLALATRIILAAGLSRGTITYVDDPSCASIDLVQSQRPGAGAAIPPGAPVDLTVGQRPKKGCP